MKRLICLSEVHHARTRSPETAPPAAEGEVEEAIQESAISKPNRKSPIDQIGQTAVSALRGPKATFEATCSECDEVKAGCAVCVLRTAGGSGVAITLCTDCRHKLKGKFRLEAKHRRRS
jgi:DNA-directed RNA polymerase subunit M/transcription elongation factor TFIIS